MTTGEAAPVASGGTAGKLAARARHAIAVRLEPVRFAGVRYGVRRLHEESELAEIGLQRYHSVFRAIWQDGAEEIGAELIELPSNILEIRRESASTRVWKQWTSLDDAVSLRVADDKPLTHLLLAQAGVAVPRNLEFTLDDRSAALAFLAEAGSPCVVKPGSGMGGGAAITTGVETASELTRASRRAARFETRLLIERQIRGHVHRFLYLDGKLLDVVRREPPRVAGDGHSTLEDLIAAENRRRLAARGHEGFHLLRVDLDCILTLRSAGLDLSHVPPPGSLVRVKTVTNQNRVEDNETVHETVHPGVVEEGARAAAAVGIRLAGVDLITTDLSHPLSETGGAVMEVNGTPGLNHHYHVADRARATRVAVPILSTLLDLYRAGRD